MNQVASSAPDFIKNKPTLGTASAQDVGAFDASGAAGTAQSAAATDATTKAAAAQSAAASDATTKAAAAQATAIQRANHTGTQSADTITDGSTNKAYTAAEKTKLGALPAITVDTGWTANNTAGDKTAALSSYSNGLNGTMVTALNVVSGGTGTALSAAMDVIVILVKKVAALETALAANKLPNA